MSLTKRAISLLLTGCIAFSTPALAYNADGAAANEQVNSTGLNVESHTMYEIQKFVDTYPTSDDDPTYKIEPSFSEPYRAGVLSDETLTLALNALNQVRYIAGLDSVRLDDSYCEYSSAATFLNALNKSMSHYPSRPGVLADSSYDDLYTKGYTGASSSNIGMGYADLPDAIFYGWCADDDSRNIDRVGHRRWVLNPKMGAVGFGYTPGHSAMYAFDRTGSGTQNYVAWPAQTMPVQYFYHNYPWSLSVDSSLDENNVSVNLVRKSDRKSWNFSKISSDGDFFVNNAGYGQRGCVIFRPDSLDTIETGDSFDVAIDLGTSSVSYTVDFFNLVDWNLDDDGTLTVSCEGDMPDYDSQNLPPWYSQKDDIRHIIVDDTVESIGDYAFCDCTNAADISIPTSLKNIGSYAFSGCSSTLEINYASCSETNWNNVVINSLGNSNFISAPVHFEEHVYGDPTESKEATCAAEGYRSYVCQKCGYSYTEKIAATGLHTYNSGRVTKEATCIEDGIKTFTCMICGHTYTESIKAAGAHTYDSGRITANASCQVDGTRIYTCIKCGDTHTETIPALGHSYKNGLCIRCGSAEPDCPITKFDDIAQGQWYHDGIHFALENGLMSGISGKSFDPNGFLSRAMIAQILYANKDKPDVFAISPFTDVEDNAWYADAVTWAAENGIVSGIGNNMFGPMNYVTREQLAVMLYGAKNKPPVSGYLDFSDSSRVSDWAKKALLWAAQNGIISGTSSGNGAIILNPQGNATRAQAAVMIMKYVQLESK